MFGNVEQHFALPLTHIDADILQRVQKRRLARYQDVIQQGDRVRYVHLLLSGLTCRYQTLQDGFRQITALQVPGDLCDYQAALCGSTEFGVCALTASVVAQLPANLLLAGRFFSQADLLERLRLDEAIARQWIVNIGRREAYQRLAHLVCEMHARMTKIGQAHTHGFKFDISQSNLADTLGISPVHMNRTVAKMLKNGLVKIKGGYWTIPDLAEMRIVARFSPNYLARGDVIDGKNQRGV